ncbi:hypothetical protein CY34DRAFT_812766 [Suillus luteus UH-Slu-Lm8-n1]|uniref:Uncharacterized protein n=1 Tax=Suillus luteus UH-Slu-Lm8-n1 TaxID=930992 RepID=A0A0C9ZYX9_9AGAM|nr:hypothetical protein CY34DRAFT_812766 [Suillus luteus UH-Slu-Lm8-n1]
MSFECACNPGLTLGGLRCSFYTIQYIHVLTPKSPEVDVSIFPRMLEIPWRLEQSLCAGHFGLHPGCFSLLVRASHTAVYIRRGHSNSDNIKFGQAFHGVFWILGKYWTPGLSTFQNIPKVAGEALDMTVKPAEILCQAHQWRPCIG